MDEVRLFLAKDGNWVTNKSLLETLLSIEADKCDTLYIHTSLSFGQPNPQLKKKELLTELLNVIKALGVKTVCMPTFTFSFCNNVDYDPLISASRMGVLNEFFRKQEGVYRSSDPLLSVALMGEDKDLVCGIGHSSSGDNSTFDKLHHRSGVKFLFLGPRIGDCFTFMHYLEWLYSVDYRYDRLFCGNVTVNGVTKKEEYALFTRYNGVVPNDGSYRYEDFMYNNGTALKTLCGDSAISIVEGKVAAQEYLKCLETDSYYFVDLTRDGKLIKDKTYCPIGEVVAM